MRRSLTCCPGSMPRFWCPSPSSSALSSYTRLSKEGKNQNFIKTDTHTVQATKESWSVTTIFYSDQLQHFQPSGPATMGFWSATTVQGWRVPPMESSLFVHSFMFFYHLQHQPLFSSFTINFNGILFNMWFSSSFNFQRNNI